MFNVYEIDNYNEPPVLKDDEGGEQSIMSLTDRNCWKVAVGYVGMTPASHAVDRSFLHPNITLVISTRGQVISAKTALRFILITKHGEILIFRSWYPRPGSHFFIFDDPNYQYVNPLPDHFGTMKHKWWIDWFMKLDMAFDDIDGAQNVGVLIRRTRYETRRQIHGTREHTSFSSGN